MTTLRQGDRGPAVRELQFLLLVTGHNPGPLDGVFGPKTLGATKAAWLGRGYTWISSAVYDDTTDMLRSLPRRAAEVPRILTPVSAVDMRIALVAGYTSSAPTEAWAAGQTMANAVRVALAQLCVEHGCEPWGGWQTQELAKKGLLPPEHLRPRLGEQSYIAVWTNNVGNRQVRREDMAPAHRAVPFDPTVPYTLLPAPEGEGAASRVLTSACYAYANVAEGAAAYWRFLRDHCGPALAAFERGDPAAAAHELKVGAWHYSGSEADYARGMVDRFAKIT